jgi:hypothetical protein
LEEEILHIQSRPLQQQDQVKEQQLVTSYEQTMTKLNDFYAQRAKKGWRQKYIFLLQSCVKKT